MRGVFLVGKEGKKKKPTTRQPSLFPWKKGCLPPPGRSVIQMPPQFGLPGRWCDRKGLGTQSRAKQPRDCDIGGELVRGEVLLSIPRRYRWMMASLGAPGKRRSGTTQKTRCAKIFGGRTELEQSPGKVESSLVPTNGLPSSSRTQDGMPVGRGTAPHHHGLLPGGQLQSRQRWPCAGQRLVSVSTVRYSLSFSRAFLSIKGLKDA